MQALRTPDERFARLPGWPYAPQYSEHAGLRVHHIDEGPRDAAVTALCLHGNPSWGYLYRHMIPEFTAAGLRVVVPDLIGFGRSDKPVAESDHRFDLHRGMLLAFIDQLDLRNILLICQDWGGIAIGKVRPKMPPQSWQTSRMFCRSSFSMNASSIPRCRSKPWSLSAAGLSERPKPIRSGTTTRSPAAVNSGSMCRYR